MEIGHRDRAGAGYAPLRELFGRTEIDQQNFFSSVEKLFDAICSNRGDVYGFMARIGKVKNRAKRHRRNQGHEPHDSEPAIANYGRPVSTGYLRFSQP